MRAVKTISEWTASDVLKKTLFQLHWFFGYSWQTRMVLVVLAAFALGCLAGVMAMLPSWWRHRRDARQRGPLVGDKSDTTASDQAMPADASAPSTLGPLPYPPDMVAPRKSGN